MPSEITRCTVSVSGETDTAVRWRMLDQTVAAIREKLADLAPDELQSIIDEASAAAREPGPAKAL